MSEFDKTTHIRNAKGDITKNNHYHLRVSRDKGEVFERPIGSGQFYSPDGKLLEPENQIESMAESLIPAKEATEIKAPVQSQVPTAKLNTNK